MRGKISTKYGDVPYHIVYQENIQANMLYVTITINENHSNEFSFTYGCNDYSNLNSLFERIVRDMEYHVNPEDKEYWVSGGIFYLVEDMSLSEFMSYCIFKIN